MEINDLSELKETDQAKLATGHATNALEAAKALDNITVELMTVEEYKGQLEDAVVRATLDLVNSEAIAPKDRLGAIDRASDLIGLKQVAPTLINTGNMQVNQLTEGASRHLLNAGSALKTLSKGKEFNVKKTAEESEEISGQFEVMYND